MEVKNWSEVATDSGKRFTFACNGVAFEIAYASDIRQDKWVCHVYEIAKGALRHAVHSDPLLADTESEAHEKVMGVAKAYARTQAPEKG